MVKTNDSFLNRKINQVFYDLGAEDYDAEHPEILEGGLDQWERFGETYIKPLRSQGPLKVLDIGCGTGFVGAVLSKQLTRNDSLVCYDISMGMLLQATKKLKGNTLCSLLFSNGDGGQLPFKDSSFDVVTSNSVLHHLTDYSSLANEMKRVLREGGVLILANEPNKQFFDSLCVRMAASLYKLLGFGVTVRDEHYQKTKQALKRKKIIDKDLEKDDLVKYVEYHSPVEQSSFGIDPEQGITSEALHADHFNKYKLLEVREYSTFLHRPNLKNKVLISSIDLLSRLIFRNRGNLFTLVLEKEKTNGAPDNTADNENKK